MICFLSGGTGTPKLVEGFRKIILDEEITIIANTADDVERYGLYISPDVDTILYLFANILDKDKFWGIKEDTFSTFESLQTFDPSTWFKLGDKDLALHLYRTERLKLGYSLFDITKDLCEKLNVKAQILPCTANHIETRIITGINQDIHFQDYWVKNKGNIEIKDTYIKNIENALIPDEVIEALDKASQIIIGPSNPITSIGPIIALPKIRKALTKYRDKCCAISPIIGQSAISGPTNALMYCKGLNPTPFDIAKLYKDFISTFIIDNQDQSYIHKIQSELNVHVVLADIIFKDTQDATNLANFLLKR